ncbi:zinc finger domain-containing protein [Cordyceps javanica]|uniref:RING-type E3 ubiquitin transferase n=1 Tax=Cordyceps javanica TaxID=43265 RepID=A0A545URV7_9HYPO|nr:zinc finger domain-containing protein [Cordyceps javanica]
MAGVKEEGMGGAAVVVAGDDDSRNTQCVICLQDLREPCEIVPCGHCLFDLACAQIWLRQNPTCPLCKVRAVRVLYGDGRGRGGGGSPPGPRLEEAAAAAALRVRRQVYAQARFSMHVGSNPVSGYRELTPDLFRHDEELVSRARLFMRRELQVFEFLSHPTTTRTTASLSSPAPLPFSPRHFSYSYSYNSSSSSFRPSPPSPPMSSPPAARRPRIPRAEFLLEYVIAMLKSVDPVGSAGAARAMLADHLGDAHARLFLHELRSWLRSPFARLEDWDRVVQYPPAAEELEAARERREREFAAREERRDREFATREARRRREEAERRMNRLHHPDDGGGGGGGDDDDDDCLQLHVRSLLLDSASPMPRRR